MDYCSSCRRHLNGALACPGCGAYAPDIAPRAAAAPAPGGTVAWQAPADTAWLDPAAHSEEAAEDPYEGPDAAPPAAMGRAARRRQRVRWKKNQRRAVVATAVALVGGGLTVASLDRQGTDRVQAATAPDNRPMGLADEQPADTTPAASAPTGRHRAPDPSSAARSATADGPREQSAGAPRATPTPRQSTVGAPRRTTASAAQPQTAVTVSGTTAGAAAQPAATPAPTATATSPSTAGTSAPAASPAPTATATSPSGLCLLVICIG